MVTTLTADIAAATDTAAVTIECLCPFCGSFHAGVGRPCSHCGTEDTTAARAAARKRVGPWFVLQARNPAAPGMSFPALLSTIRSGRVTDRSVVRGPATGQLWRLAGKVRGLSREFGLCYGCGGDLSVADPACPHCQRPQSLPADIDADPAAANGYVPRDPADRRPPKDDLLTHRDVAKAFSLGFTPAAGQGGTALLPSAPPARVQPRVVAAATLGLVALVAGTWTLTRLFAHGPAQAAAETVAVTPATPAFTSTPVATAAPVVIAPAVPVQLPRRQPVVIDEPPVARPAMLVRQVAAVEPAVIANEPSTAAIGTDDPRQLMAAGLAAEARGDYRGAIAQYERLESLSSDQWPAGLKDRLKLARRAARGDAD